MTVTWLKSSTTLTTWKLSKAKRSSLPNVIWRRATCHFRFFTGEGGRLPAQLSGGNVIRRRCWHRWNDRRSDNVTSLAGLFSSFCVDSRSLWELIILGGVAIPVRERLRSFINTICRVVVHSLNEAIGAELSWYRQLAVERTYLFCPRRINI